MYTTEASIFFDHLYMIVENCFYNIISGVSFKICA